MHGLAVFWQYKTRDATGLAVAYGGKHRLLRQEAAVILRATMIQVGKAFLSKVPLQWMLRLQTIGRGSRKGMSPLCDASVAKCDRFNSILSDSHPRFPISSYMLPTVAASGECTY